MSTTTTESDAPDVRRERQNGEAGARYDVTKKEEAGKRALGRAGRRPTGAQDAPPSLLAMAASRRQLRW